MTNVEQTRRLVRRALDLLDRQLNATPDPLLVLVPPEQFVLFRGILEQMLQMLAAADRPDPNHPPLPMSDTIIGSWPFTPLGSAIVKAERAFRDSLAPDTGQPMD